MSDLSIDEFKKYCNNIEEDVYKSLGAVNVAGNYVTEGSGSAEQSKKRINYWNRRLGKK